MPENTSIPEDMYGSLEELVSATQKEILDLVKKKHPEVEEIAAKLKEQYKEIYLYAFSEDEFYIYRPIKRFEYKKLTMQYAENQEKLGEEIVKLGVLHPKLDDEKLDDLKAGTVATLLELIFAASNFGASAPAIKL